MAYFRTVKALYLTSVVGRLVRAFLFLLLMGLPGLSCVFSGGRGGAFLTLSVSSLLLLLLLFPSFLGRLRTLGTWRCFCTSDFRFFQPGVLHGATLPVSRIGWLVAPAWGQCWSISLKLERGRKADLALASTAFLIIWSKLSSLRSRCSSSAKMEGLRPFRKYLSIVGRLGL